MTQRTPEEIAREAVERESPGWESGTSSDWTPGFASQIIEQVVAAERAAGLAALRSAVEAEREACAKVAEEIDPIFSATNRVLDEVAEAIRARGKA